MVKRKSGGTMNRRSIESMLMRMKFELDLLNHRIEHHLSAPDAKHAVAYAFARTECADACHKLISAAEVLRNAKT